MMPRDEESPDAQGTPVAPRRLAVLADVPLERDVFLRTLLRHLTGALEDVVGLDEASGFLSLVGQEMGEQISDMYREALAAKQLSPEQVADVLVDLKRRIQGDFYVIEQDGSKIVFGNRACPFGDKVAGRPSLCMMTSNVFGFITARELGYARVELAQTIALGHDGCVVIVHLKPFGDERAVSGREYHRGVEARAV